MWFCYLLHNTQPQYKNATYSGSTNNPKRRLRQHNREITGGAKATGRCVGGWEFCALLSGFETHQNCLSCEWRIKCPTGRPGRRAAKYIGPAGRIASLNEVLPLDKWTGPCTILNCDQAFKLLVLRDYVEQLHLDAIPSNIEVVVVDTIDIDALDTASRT